mmetsp:Transcript_51845/g.103877  ORF Transcript_51845/g.103877 Transcript_51845/m.103877 type:complete len:90 (+) Transcript_51845:307-576(+)
MQFQGPSMTTPTSFEMGCTFEERSSLQFSANPRSIHCKSGPSGVICMRALNCVLVGLYFPPVTAPQAVGTMEALADAINDGTYSTDKES